jgi:hypothetical protein
MPASSSQSRLDQSVNLGDAELQQTTGSPIVKGQLSIGSEADMTSLGIPRHDRVMLPTQALPSSLFVWPVASVTRDNHGFCDVTLGKSGFAFHGFRVQDIGSLASPGASRSFTRGGLDAGNLIGHEGFVRGSPKWILRTPIDA